MGRVPPASIRDQASLSRRGLRGALTDWLALTKPHTTHVLVGAIPAVLLAGRGNVPPLLRLNTLAGAILMAAGANTLNCVVDADIDKLMNRTDLPGHRKPAMECVHDRVHLDAVTCGQHHHLVHQRGLKDPVDDLGPIGLADAQLLEHRYRCAAVRNAEQQHVHGSITNPISRTATLVRRPIALRWFRDFAKGLSRTRCGTGFSSNP